MPSTRLLEEVRLWPLQHGIPTTPAYKVLCHLAQNPNARAYMKPGNDYYIAVDNGDDGTQGWVVQGQVFGMLHGCHSDRRPWLKRDRQKRVTSGGLRVYTISQAGFEAIAQYTARHRYTEAHLRLAKKLLDKGRRMARALKPT